MRGGDTPSGGGGGSQIAIVLISLMLVVAGGIAGVVLLGRNVDDQPDDGDPDPDLKIVSEDAGYDGIPFNFTVDVTGIDQGDVTISWDFGDGKAGSGHNVEHIYEETGTYKVTLTILDGKEVVLQTTKMVTVAPASGPTKGLLPDKRIPGWNIEFTGGCGEGTLALLDIVTNPDMIMEINLTLDDRDRSFVGVELMEVFDLAGIRFDADTYTVTGDTTFTSDVFTTLSLPMNGGNSTYLMLIEDGTWLEKSEMNSTFMLVGPGGEVVTNVHTIDIDRSHLVITGQGIPQEISLTLDQIDELFELTNYNVSDGREMYHLSGYPLWPILEHASIMRNATDVSFRSLDGYAVDLPVNYVYDNPESEDRFFLAIGEDGV
ncbi:MAG: PKD domain-containing protein, partial [Thermoplasmata archaeon]|nr:PKD domain-containing protein [Thermoplasmata archaeon]